MSDTTHQENRIEYLHTLAAAGLGLYIPESNELQIDFDSPNAESFAAHAAEVEALLQPELRVKKYIYTTFKSGNLHIRIFLSRNLSPFERCFLQLAFRSDWKREICNFRRTLFNTQPTILLAETPEAVAILQSHAILPNYTLPKKD